jgi:hypothetical protein
MYVRQPKELTGHQVLVQSVHCLHVTVLDFEASNLRVLDDPFLLHTLGQGHVAVLQAPADQQLAWGAGILVGKGYNGWVLHPQGSDKRRVCLYNNIMLLAKGSNILPPSVQI